MRHGEKKRICKKLNDMGIDEYTEIMQNQIDRFEEYGK